MGMKNRKKPNRGTPVTTTASSPRPTPIDLENKEGSSPLVPPELSAGLSLRLRNVRAETVRSDTLDAAIVNDVHEALPQPSHDQLASEDFTLSDQPRPESNDIRQASSSYTERSYEKTMPEEEISQDLEEQTKEDKDGEGLGQYCRVLPPRASQHVKSVGVEGSPIMKETPVRHMGFSSVLGSVRDYHRPSLPCQAPPAADESKVVLDFVLLVISKHQGLIVESATANESNADVESRDFTLRALDSLHSDLRQIGAIISPRFA